jgi:two-component system, NarL family, response regulator DevR
MNVLVVSDSQPVGGRIVELFSKLVGIRVIGQLRNGEVALRCIVAETPSVVIVDAHLEGGTGMEVLRKIRLLKTPPLVVTVSTSSHPQYYRQSMREGADYCFQLPEEIDKLIEVLKGLK